MLPLLTGPHGSRGSAAHPPVGPPSSPPSQHTTWLFSLTPRFYRLLVHAVCQYTGLHSTSKLVTIWWVPRHNCCWSLVPPQRSYTRARVWCS